jgi:ABC-type transport system substrate-binding protein
LLGALACRVAWVVAIAGCPSLPDGPRYIGAGQKTPVRGGTLMVWDQSRVRMLDPHIAFDVTSHSIINLLFDSLYDYDREMRLVPALASELPKVTREGRSLTVPLRRGVRFHNGRELTASDVVWSFERMLHPDLHSPGAVYYSAVVGFDAFQKKQSAHVQGLSAPDPYTFQIELEQADQSFVHTLALRFSAPIPREMMEGTNKDLRRRAIGTGPFKLTSWDPGVRIVLERNDRYFQKGRPYLDRIVFEEGLKRDTAFLRFRNGEVDIMPMVGPADQMLLRGARWKPFTATIARPDVFALFMNTEMAPFDNVHVRRAVAFAIDRERWAKTRNHMIRPTGQILPPNIAGYDPNLPHRQRFDLARARAEMRLAGFPNGLSEPVTLWTSDGTTGRAYGELAQADLGRIGIELQLKQVSFPVYLEETGKPRTAQLVAGGWSMDFPDASNFLNLVSSKTKAEQDSSNRSFFSDPKLDALLDRALIEPDPERRVAMYREANDFVADAAPWAIFANTQGPQAWQPYVRGYAPHPVYWMPIAEVWLDLPRKRIAQLRERLLSDSALAHFLPRVEGWR